MALVSTLACQRTETTTRLVNLHTTGACPIPATSDGVYVALGDYNPPTPNHSSLLATDLAGQTIDGIPSNLQSLALMATPPDESTWLGVTLVPPTGDLDMLLLPAASACGLNTKVGFASGMVFGAVSDRVMIASGGDPSPQKSFRIDLATGHVDTMQNGLRQSRLRAAVASLGGGRAIVTGGVNLGSSPLNGAGNAEIFDSAIGDFEPNVVDITEPREDHAAVTLASGNVLLVGGQSASGLIQQTDLLFFDPSISRFRPSESKTAPLVHARTNPYALKLADGTIMVGGGFDANNAPVPFVELFAPDGSSEIGSMPVQLQPMHAFVALDGGGALVVTAPPTQTAYFVTPNVATALPIANPPSLTGATTLALFARAGGGALLWTGASWLSFDPWTGFSSPVDAPTTGPDAASPTLTTDPGMRTWVSLDGSLNVWRDSTRNAFATEGPYLLSDTSFMAPNLLTNPPFDETGLSLDDSAVAVFVADARYLDVAVDVDGVAGNLPHIVFQSPNAMLEVGGTCPFTDNGSTHMHVERRGELVSFSLGGPLQPCGPPGNGGAGVTIATGVRVAVGVRGGATGARARNLVITRLSPAN